MKFFDWLFRRNKKPIPVVFGSNRGGYSGLAGYAIGQASQDTYYEPAPSDSHCNDTSYDSGGSSYDSGGSCDSGGSF